MWAFNVLWEHVFAWATAIRDSLLPNLIHSLEFWSIPTEPVDCWETTFAILRHRLPFHREYLRYTGFKTLHSKQREWPSAYSKFRSSEIPRLAIPTFISPYAFIPVASNRHLPLV